MTELASAGQLRASYLRWALVLVPGIILLGSVSALFGSARSDWFTSLVKPSIFPPAAVFGPVWTVLYALMGLALAMVVTARGAWGRERAVIAFAVQLVLNLAWSPVFFGLHQITAALVVIALLDVAVIATIALFWRVRPLAAIMLLPYLAWILFATALTWEFRAANPEADGRQGSTATQRIQL